jgi:hypothetical protein
VLNAIHSPDGRIAQLMQSHPSDGNIVEEIFLATLARYPTAREKAAALDSLKQAASRKEGAEDLMWALLNSPAFLFNR